MTLFSNVNHTKTHEEVAHQIEGLILEGVLQVGDKLPGERMLADELSVSRPIVREAIKHLETEGILKSRHGEGTFVANVIGTVFSPQISRILPKHDKATLDFLQYRREIEATAAGFAADRATAKDLELFDKLMQRMDAAHANEDFELEGKIDVEFHHMIGEMAHNLVLLHTLRACYQLLLSGIFENRSKIYSLADGREAIYQQHRAIYKAICSRDSDAARQASKSHLDYIIEKTIALRDAEDRERVSALRLEAREKLQEGTARVAKANG